MRIIYVAGLYHSGSTLLDNILGMSGNIIGLGEIYKSYYDGFEKYCSCGSRPNECDFWKNIIPENYNEPQQFYDKVLAEFEERFGPKILLDSSKCHPLPFKRSDKNFKGLNYLKNTDIDLYVIHLVRDPRSWCRNIIRRKIRFKKGVNYPVYKKINDNLLIRYLQWIYGHVEIRKFLKKNELKYIRINYDDLVFETSKTLNQIKSFIEINIDSDLFTEKTTSNSHITVGNPSRHNFKKIQKINYDRRWLSDSLSFKEVLIWKLFSKTIKKLLNE